MRPSSLSFSLDKSTLHTKNEALEKVKIVLIVFGFGIFIGRSWRPYTHTFSETGSWRPQEKVVEPPNHGRQRILNVE